MNKYLFGNSNPDPYNKLDLVIGMLIASPHLQNGKHLLFLSENKDNSRVVSIISNLS